MAEIRNSKGGYNEPPKIPKPDFIPKGHTAGSDEISFGVSTPEELEAKLKHNEELVEGGFHIQKPDLPEDIKIQEMIPDSPLETDNVWKQRYFSLLSAYNMMADTLRNT